MTPVGAKADVCRRQVRLIVIATLGPVKAQPGVSAEINANIKAAGIARARGADRKSTRLNSSHVAISYAVFCLKKKTQKTKIILSREHQKSYHSRTCISNTRR